MMVIPLWDHVAGFMRLDKGHAEAGGGGRAMLSEYAGTQASMSSEAEGRQSKRKVIRTQHAWSKFEEVSLKIGIRSAFACGRKGRESWLLWTEVRVSE